MRFPWYLVVLALAFAAVLIGPLVVLSAHR